MTLLVHLEKDYLFDVNFGDSFRMPLEFPNGELRDVCGIKKFQSLIPRRLRRGLQFFAKRIATRYPVACGGEIH